MFSFWKRQQRKQLAQNRAYELTLNLTKHERQALFHFVHNLVPVYVQLPLGAYIADFVGVNRNFIIEIDGWTHDGSDIWDDRRSDFFVKHGFEVFRIDNEEVNNENIMNLVRQCKIVGTDKMRYLIEHLNGNY